ncbi:uncharacterized protein L969DRAFT_86929 [Mixia osmundae IAM 14324]|uniref:GTP cyclohydrolase II domain-containing protein n=1 Tax=Mixia osmundae (strain CBS 9802 / IAM 14324 / JCM 22182 / KY 12970) TaxID=764103 RepID=G7E936_MIXOS|nr:uncharacterized protein L969DRAFT_86929 [Mixia osmundae IAM 14324]KEI40290.1 hypothetical protein L969DRAFT_86929 [Mixia osmundae IAM 14324]GAA99654.1 hypothetical protein E5Q_06357 [Mixia osmundae IAM 14324]
MGDASMLDVLQSILFEVKDLKTQQAALKTQVDSISQQRTSRLGSETGDTLSPDHPNAFGSPSTLLPQRVPSLSALSTALAGSPRDIPAVSLPASQASTPLTLPVAVKSAGFRVGSPGATSSSFHARAASRGMEDSLREKERFLAWSHSQSPTSAVAPTGKKEPAFSTRVVLTTYPTQVGIDPIPLNWGARTALERGPVVASRQPDSLKIRNAIGAYAGPYCVYRALAMATGNLDPLHRPDYTHTEPPFDLPPQPAWFDPYKIVSLDPWSHMSMIVYKQSHLDKGIDVRPTISVTRAHLKLAEIDEAVLKGRIKVDGKIIVPTPSAWSDAAKQAKQAGSILTEEARAEMDLKIKEAGVDIVCGKAAIDNVWWLPGIAHRFGISENILRRALFEETGGMYPELLTRPDLKTFLPPISGATAYIIGNPAYLSDPSKVLSLRVHDECSGSDVFGSDVCTCRPYLIYGIEHAVKTAQEGGVGLVIYYRKEGRALGEVVKYLVYCARKYAEDSAKDYFKRTEDIAGVKDMRFQELMPDPLHWLGVTKIDHLWSMSDMKYNAITSSGISVLNRHDLPDHLIGPDAHVEIDAKIAAGYFSAGKKVTSEDLSKTVGRSWEPTNWEDVAH